MMKKTFLVLTGLIFVAACSGGSGGKSMGNGTTGEASGTVTDKCTSLTAIQSSIAKLSEGPYCKIDSKVATVSDELSQLPSECDTVDEYIAAKAALSAYAKPTVAVFFAGIENKITSTYSIQRFFQDYFSGDDYLNGCDPATTTKADAEMAMANYIVANQQIANTGGCTPAAVKSKINVHILYHPAATFSQIGACGSSGATGVTAVTGGGGGQHYTD
jgi:hypothetical protein